MVRKNFAFFSMFTYFTYIVSILNHEASKRHQAPAFLLKMLRIGRSNACGGSLQWVFYALCDEIAPTPYKAV